MSSAPFTSSLLDWYGANARDLPWRRIREPYAIWISEIMLQQTQVKTVLPRYTAWLEQFPDIKSVANTELDAVLKAWEGLGYYRRARLLHTAAQTVAADFNGSFPTGFNDILSLPGIGRSTAGAISSFCFGSSTPVLDGNVKRVLRRWHNHTEASDTQLWQLAQQHIDHTDAPAAWNQAMMELGATVCTPRSPACAGCPVRHDCRSAFNICDRPAAKRAQIQELHWQVQLHIDDKRGIWLTRRPADGIWANLWTPPITELPAAPEKKPCHIHLLTHRRLHLYAVFDNSPATETEGRWMQTTAEIAIPTGIRRLLQRHCIA